MKVLRYAVIAVVLALLSVAGPPLSLSAKSDRGSQAWAEGAPAKDDPVVATVNGEAIHESGLAMKPRDDGFKIEEADARKSKLTRLIEALALRQFLRNDKAIVPESEIDRRIENLRRTPPSAGCPCCRYASLEQFLDINNMDMKELRQMIANDLGMEKHLLGLWEKEYPSPEARQKLVRQERPRLEREYVKASQVFFKTCQNPDFARNPNEVRRTAGLKAEAAWKELQGGKPFETVVQARSEDAVSKPNGGSLGCISINLFGQDFANAVVGLKPGEYSKPAESAWGFHVVRREAMDDNDVLQLMKNEYGDMKRPDILNRIWANAKIERF